MHTSPLSDLRRAAAWFHALSDIVRLSIVELLAHQQRSVSELERALDINTSRLSFHLRVLERSGLVKTRRDGRWVYYAIESAVLEEVIAYVGLQKPGKRPDSCALACCQSL
jgi:ArsR family transcriptional regulator, arsenate/arsenite/antimonite-responsive transcriptional repressor